MGNPLPSSSSGVRAVGQIDVPGLATPGGSSIDSSSYEFDDQHVRADASGPAWRVAHRAVGEAGEGGELSEPELRQRRREAMVLQDGVEVFDEEDTDYILPRTAP